jgi:hypothetical protein
MRIAKVRALVKPAANRRNSSTAGNALQIKNVINPSAFDADAALMHGVFIVTA